MNTKIRFSAFSLTLLVWLFLLAYHPAELQSAECHITLDRSTVQGTFAPELLSANLQWTSGCDGMLEQTGMRMNNASVSAAAQLSPPVLRYPGGLLSSLYEWRKGVSATRGTSPNYEKNPEEMRCGSDEFGQILRALSAKGMITANLTRTPAEAAEWLTYLRGNGVATPWWEVGNESYLPAEPSYTTAAQYGTRVREFSKALKTVDPAVKVGAILEGSVVHTAWGGFIVPELSTWNSTVIKATATDADFYSLHLYAPFGTLSSDNETIKAMLAAPVALAKNIADISKTVKAANPKAQIFVTEFNIGMDTPTANWRFSTTLAQAGYVAQMLGYSARHGVAQANFWSLIGNHNFGLVKSGTDPRLRPAGLLYKALKPLAGASVIGTAVAAPKLSYTTVGNVPAGMNVPAVWAQAFTQGGDVWVMIVNRAPARTFTVDIKDSKTGAVASYTLWKLNAPTPLSTNEQSDTVTASEVTAGPAFTLPPAGVALVRFKAQP